MAVPAGGLSTTIHLAVRGLGNPVAFRRTAGHRDVLQAPALIAGQPPTSCWQMTPTMPNPFAS